jgi:hypothetical protein
MGFPASIKQVSFLKTLLEERLHEVEVDFASLESGEASYFISKLLRSPMRNAGVSELGMYRTPNGDIYRVHQSRETGNLYAKKLDIISHKFEYEQGAMRKLKASDKMTLEQAKAWGMETGICCVCGAFLTDERSVAEGIGPVCAGRV